MKNGALVGSVTVKDVTQDDVLEMIILGRRPATAAPN
jgi:D-xylose transport system ATP-binding protein